MYLVESFLRVACVKVKASVRRQGSALAEHRTVLQHRPFSSFDRAVYKKLDRFMKPGSVETVRPHHTSMIDHSSVPRPAGTFFRWEVTSRARTGHATRRRVIGGSVVTKNALFTFHSVAVPSTDRRRRFSGRPAGSIQPFRPCPVCRSQPSIFPSIHPLALSQQQHQFLLYPTNLRRLLSEMWTAFFTRKRNKRRRGCRCCRLRLTMDHAIEMGRPAPASHARFQLGQISGIVLPSAAR